MVYAALGRAGPGRNCDGIAAWTITHRPVAGSTAAFRLCRLEFAAFSVKSMGHDCRGSWHRSSRAGRAFAAGACASFDRSLRCSSLGPDVQRPAAAGAAGFGPRTAVRAGDESGSALRAGIDSKPAGAADAAGHRHGTASGGPAE